MDRSNPGRRRATFPSIPGYRFLQTIARSPSAEVHVALLRSLTVELDEAGTAADTLVAIGQLTERLDQTRVAARAEFAERFADYDSPTTARALDAMLEAIAP